MNDNVKMLALSYPTLMEIYPESAPLVAKVIWGDESEKTSVLNSIWSHLCVLLAINESLKPASMDDTVAIQALMLAMKNSLGGASPTGPAHVNVLEWMESLALRFIAESVRRGGYFHHEMFPDLFEDFDAIPEDLKSVLLHYERYEDCMSVGLLEEMLCRCKALGYTFDYGLELSPFRLRSLNITPANALVCLDIFLADEYSDAGDVIGKGCAAAYIQDIQLWINSCAERGEMINTLSFERKMSNLKRIIDAVIHKQSADSAA